MSEVTRKFLNCFAKYKPNDNALWLLDLLTDFKTRINRENRIVVCNCTAKRLCDCDTLKAEQRDVALGFLRKGAALGDTAAVVELARLETKCR